MNIKVGIWNKLTNKDKIILLKAVSQHSITRKTA
ncbi:hypothetical protein SAMN05192559_104357 [Halobacillus karajensis]|uniref:Uncharacterized protein n=1 Tax=Halobacillus karajensis TaxID=195088 RepID=A0A024P163_9BACI|nr:hypothetical protein BN982_01711 [Halobacillus karajensis]CDQ21880.1 hypothetical protein BN983_00075 [Halobacillus karajensis]CDQ27720.1 hypothetical protein BN981_02001 [Halobacillus karajensis]SEH82886.1 hypothetical protein SAMN05192559_104357 [Halobacillus karajensis]